MTQAKEFVFEDTAREKLKAGVETLADVASVTLGPKGRNVGLSNPWGSPTITSDGHSIVKEIEVKDQYINMGVQMGKEVASKMKEACGDGTTTSIILLNALTKEGVKLVTSGVSPILLKRGMEKALIAFHTQIDKMAEKLEGAQAIAKMAESAASGSLEIGKMLSAAFEQVGSNGAITIEEGKGTEDTLTLVDGMQIDRGYLSPHFCTNRDKMEVELHKPKILITDKKIQSIHELVPLLQQVAASGSSLLIIAEDIEGDALATLVINNLKGILKVAAIKAPGFGDHRKALLEDLAILTGAQVITEEAGLVLKEASVELLGSCDKVVITKDKTLFTSSKDLSSAVQKRIKQLEHELAQPSLSSYDKEKLEERKSKLAGGVALIEVGAPTESEMKKKKQLFQDALSSTRAALEGGMVVGAGMSLTRAAQHIRNDQVAEAKLGFDLVVKVAKTPALQIIKNAGHDPLTTLEQALAQGDDWGFNMMSEKIENLKKSGVVDAAKVVKTALSLAISTAGVILLSEALLGNAPEEEI